MNKLVYLFELDSVCNTREGIEAGQQAMFEEIAQNGNSVVLSFNQLTDSCAFMAAVKDKHTYPYILELFRVGALKVSHYGKIRTPSQYLQNAIEKCKQNDESVFLFSALPIKSSDKELREKIHSALRYSDPAILTEMVEEKQRQLDNSLSEQRQSLQAEIAKLDFLDRYVRMILLLSTEKLSGNKPIGVKTNPFSWYMNKAIQHCSHSKDTIIVEAVGLLDEIRREISDEPDSDSLINNRSDWLTKLYKRENCEAVLMGKAIIDLCYNYTVEESICGVSRHFDGKNQKKLLEDFDKRLKKYWADFKNGLHILDECDNSSLLEQTVKLPHWATAVRLYSAHTVQPSADGSIYEKNYKREKALWKLKIVRKLFKTLGLSCIYIVVLVAIDLIMGVFQDILFNSDGMSLLQALMVSGLSSLMFGVIGSIIALAPWLPDFLDVFRSIFNCFVDAIITKLAPHGKAYRNTEFRENNDEY